MQFYRFLQTPPDTHINEYSYDDKRTLWNTNINLPKKFKNLLWFYYSNDNEDLIRELKDNFLISENFSYKNNSDKFELESYEREIKNNLAELAAEKLIIKISGIQ
jgi:hypothetical protein